MPFRFNAAFNGPRRDWLSHRASIMVIMLLFLGMAGHDLSQTWTERSRVIADTQREAGNLAWSTAQHAADVFRQADTSLLGVIDLMEIDGTGPPRVERLRKLMARRLTNSPVLQGLAFYDEDGFAVVNAMPATPRINVSDRAYFQYHVTHPDRDPYTSELILSRFTGKRVVTVSRRVNHAGGGFGGVVAGAIEFSNLQDFYATFDLGHDGMVSLLRDDGVLLVRQPFVEAAIGTNLRAFR